MEIRMLQIQNRIVLRARLESFSRDTLNERNVHKRTRGLNLIYVDQVGRQMRAGRGRVRG